MDSKSLEEIFCSLWNIRLTYYQADPSRHQLMFFCLWERERKKKKARRNTDILLGISIEVTDL